VSLKLQYLFNRVLNGKTATIPLQFSTNSDTSLSFDGVMNLENWDLAAGSINQ
jgi:hypothetical protein